MKRAKEGHNENDFLHQRAEGEDLMHERSSGTSCHLNSCTDCVSIAAQNSNRKPTIIYLQGEIGSFLLCVNNTIFFNVWGA